MKLEEAIKQVKFKNEYHKLLLNLIYTSNMLKLNFECKLRKYGITSEQFNVLRILRGQHPKPATINLIIERMLDKSSNASRLVEKLRKKDLVQRTVSEEDRRSVNVIISKSGLELLEKVDSDEEKWLNEMQEISVEEARQLNFLLDKLKK